MRLQSSAWRHALAALCLAWTLCATGCGGGDALEVPTYPHTSAKNAWESSGIRDYEFRLQQGCFCPPELFPELKVTVRNGEVVQAMNGETLLVGSALGDVPTISRLYRMLDEVSAREGGSVQFGVAGSTGQLTNVYLDYDRHAYDEEMGYSIRFFRRI